MGSPPGNVTQSTTSWLKEKPCHTDGPSPNSSKCHRPSHRTCQANQLEGADHSKLKQLQYYIQYISLVLVSQYQSQYIEAAVAAAFISHKSGAAHTASVGKHTL